MEDFEKSKLESEKYRYFTGHTRKPLVCCICDDYYQNPCLLSCYHSFCARCLENRTNNGVIFCPLCGTQTECEAGKFPSDILLKKLIDLFNMDNPPCANCDKRNRTSMYFCSTCNQSLCGICRENTHRAKMFSAHEVLPVAKFSQEGQKKCGIHGEPYVMYSVTQKLMLCVNCFRDMPPESRQQCVDVDSAYTQAIMKLESVITTVCETQNSVRESILVCRNHLDELLHNTDSEKMTVHSFTQGLQEAINKTQNSVLLEVQRQYEVKERSFRNQLVSLSIVLPILQQHIILCQTFSSSANKFQFLEVVFSLIDRINTVANLPRFMNSTMSSHIRSSYRSEFAQCLELWVGRLLASSVQHVTESVYETALPPKIQSSTQLGPSVAGGPPSQKQQSALKVKALEGDGPFSNHCRSFNNQVKELGTLMKNVRERLGEFRKDVTVLHRTATPPLVLRYQVISQDCSRLNETLEQIQVELERLKSVFQSIWQEQLYRIHVEQDIFQQQMTDVINLRGEVKLLSATAQNLEPYISQLSSCGEPGEIAKLKSLLAEISQLKDSHRLRSDKVPKGLSRRSHFQSSVSLSADTKSLAGDEIKRETSMRNERAQSVSEHKSSRGVFSQLIDKVRNKEKSDSYRERSKSTDRLKECTNQACQKVYSACSESNVRLKKRASSLYRVAYDEYKVDDTPKDGFDEEQKLSEGCNRKMDLVSNFPPKEVEKYSDFHWKEQSFKGPGTEKKESDYQSINEATSVFQTRNTRCYSSDEEDFSRVQKRRPSKKSAPPSPPPRTNRRRYPHSDTEESIFYTDSYSRSLPIGTSTKDGKAIFLVIGSSKGKSGKRVQKQRSWETFPPKKKLEDVSSMYYVKNNPENYKSQFDILTVQSEAVKKSDSFEGHEEAVSSLVREFQKIRMLQKGKSGTQPSSENA